MRYRHAAVAVAVLAVLTGCGPSGGATPSPTSSSATSSASQTPSPTPSVTVAQAERTYRALVEAKYQAQKQGGISPDAQLPAGITANAEGQALKDYKDVLNQTFNKGSRWVSGTYRITGVAQSDDQSDPDAQIVLVACEDGRGIHTSWPNGQKSTGLLVKTTSWYRLTTDGTVKQIAYETNRAASCDVK